MSGEQKRCVILLKIGEFPTGIPYGKVVSFLVNLGENCPLPSRVVFVPYSSISGQGVLPISSGISSAVKALCNSLKACRALAGRSLAFQGQSFGVSSVRGAAIWVKFRT